MAGQAILMRMLLTLEPRDIFGSNFCILIVFELCPATGMQNDDEASPSIILAGRAYLVKMHITLELHVIFVSNFASSYSFTRYRHWAAKQDKASSSISVAGYG